MPILDDIKQLAEKNGTQLSEKKGVYTFKIMVAQRKAFMSLKTLEYIAQFRINDEQKEVKFTEMLKESGSGLSMGGDMDNMSPGFGFKAGVYKTGMSGRQGSIQEQSNLFGKTYEYKFDFGAVRKQIEAMAAGQGYKFSYQITAIGL